MLRRPLGGEGDGVIVVGGDRHQTVVAECVLDGVAAIETRQQVGDRPADRIGDFWLGGDEDDRRVGSVLGLGQQVGGDQA